MEVEDGKDEACREQGRNKQTCDSEKKKRKNRRTGKHAAAGKV
jgi:hypothetical protein